jgi:HD-GYP domain-containing protein (c-di-GMP phosphodiesterase class II)
VIISAKRYKSLYRFRRSYLISTNKFNTQAESLFFMSESSRKTDMQTLGIFNRLEQSTREIVYKLDALTYSHCRYLSILSKHFGDFLQLSAREIELLTLGAYFHDIGKAFVPLNILNKPTSLNSEEWASMRLHPQIDNSILRFPKDMEDILPIIQQHHERWDGSGYPHGLSKEEIPYLARIVQIVDIYDALTHTRSYKRNFSSQTAIAIILEESAKGWYQLELVELFLAFIASEEKRNLNPIGYIRLPLLQPWNVVGNGCSDANSQFANVV